MGVTKSNSFFIVEMCTEGGKDSKEHYIQTRVPLNEISNLKEEPEKKDKEIVDERSTKAASKAEVATANEKLSKLLEQKADIDRLNLQTLHFVLPQHHHWEEELWLHQGQSEG